MSRTSMAELENRREALEDTQRQHTAFAILHERAEALARAKEEGIDIEEDRKNLIEDMKNTLLDTYKKSLSYPDITE